MAKQPVNKKALTSAEVLLALLKKWPATEYVCIPEAPGRDNRTIDLLAISLWSSRNHEVHAVEIKVSMSDFRREISKGAKAQWWWEHSNRFWVAMPWDLAYRAKEELPDTWGLIAVKDDLSTKVVVTARKRERRMIPWSTITTLMRRAGSAGLSALQRAKREGYEEGVERGKREALNFTEPGAVQARYDSLRRRVDAFKEASGIDIEAEFRDDLGNLGRMVAVVRSHARDPEFEARSMKGKARQLRALAARIEDTADEYLDIFTPKELA